MQSAQAEVRSFYKSGFPREVHRGKYDLMINERLKAARNRKGLSAAGVVKKLQKQGIKIGHSTLQGYEADESSLNHRYPSLPVLVQLADFYGCSLDYLFGISDKYKPSTGTREYDVKDVLECRGTVAYNGIKLTQRQREYLITQLDTIVAEMF
jgi:transcriptional regulator with XRE-family HTH domain